MEAVVVGHKNRILASLPAGDFAMLEHHLTQLDMEKGRLLFDPGDPITTVYFPLDCVISVMTLMESGEAIESVTIGREGAYGLASAISPREARP